MLHGNDRALIAAATSCHGKIPAMAVKLLGGNLVALKNLLHTWGFEARDALVEELAKLVDDLTDADTNILVLIVKDSKNEVARVTALEKINNPEALYSVITSSPDIRIIRMILENLTVIPPYSNGLP